KRTAAALPFVIAAFNPVANAYTVVGLAGDPKAPSNRQGRAGRSEGDEEIDQRNPFSQAFRQTADRTGARTKHDSFEGSVVEIAGPDLATFIEYLHLYL
ncbi:DNA replication initiation factor cdc45, partial [Tieghemiomyces parasiticus]